MKKSKRKKIIFFTILIFFIGLSYRYMDLPVWSQNNDANGKDIIISGIGNKIFIPDDYLTISEGIEASQSGDTIIVEAGIYEESYISLKPNILLRSASSDDVNQIAPSETIIDGGGESTVIYGAENATIMGFTIKNGGVGIGTWYDYMNLSNNIIHSCSYGILLTSRDVELVNNTIVQNYYSNIYIEKADIDSSIPNIKCRNNIIRDCDWSIYVNIDSNYAYSIDPNELDNMISDFSYNNISSDSESNLWLDGVGKGNISSDPYFEDADAGIYLLKSYSTSIDAGDPNSDFSQEPSPNGSRINLGAFGNTIGAQKSFDSDSDGIKDYIEGLADNNQNGYPDWDDNKCVVFLTSTGIGYESEYGGKLVISIDADPNLPLAFTDISALDSNSPIISNRNLPNSNFNYGLWEFTINGMNKGDTISIKIHCSEESFFNFQKYYSCDYENGWALMATEMDASDLTIIFQITDGGSGDMDLEKDGSIYHIGGCATPLSIEGYDLDNCFISNL